MPGMPDMTSLFNMGSLTSVIVMVPFIIVALALAYVGLRSRRRAGSSGHWIQAQGRVLHADVQMRRSSNGRGGINTFYYPVVVYEYVANGYRYQNNRMNFGSPMGYGSPTIAQEIVGRYHPGNIIDVYFDPANPQDSVLERRAGGSSNLLLVTAGVIVLLLVCTAVMTFAGFGFAGQLVNQIMGNLPVPK
jgi:hypothetical protein